MQSAQRGYTGISEFLLIWGRRTCYMVLSICARRYLRGEISGVRQYERFVQLVGCHTHRFLVSSCL